MTDPEGTVSFEVGGEKYTSIFSYRAMKAVEVYYDKPFFRAIQHVMPNVALEDADDKSKMAQAAADIRFSDLGELLKFSLLKFHPDLVDDEVENIIDEMGMEAVAAVLGQALAAALSGSGKKDGAQNPPKRLKKSIG